MINASPASRPRRPNPVGAAWPASNWANQHGPPSRPGHPSGCNTTPKNVSAAQATYREHHEMDILREYHVVELRGLEPLTPTLPGRDSPKIANLQALEQPKRRSIPRKSPPRPVLDRSVWHEFGTGADAHGHYRGRCPTADQPESEKPSWHLSDGNASEQGGRPARRNFRPQPLRKRRHEDLPQSTASGANEAADRRSLRTGGSARPARTSLIVTTSSCSDFMAATLPRHTRTTSSAGWSPILARRHVDGTNPL